MFRGDFSPNKCHERRELGGAERFNPLLHTRKSPWTLRSLTQSHVSPVHDLFRGEVLVGRGGFALSISLQQPCSRGRLGPASNWSSSPWTLLSLTFLKGPLDFPLILLRCVIHDGFCWIVLSWAGLHHSRWVGLCHSHWVVLRRIIRVGLDCVGSGHSCWLGSNHLGWVGLCWVRSFVLGWVGSFMLGWVEVGWAAAFRLGCIELCCLGCTGLSWAGQ